ncbi:MAG: NAD(P)-dependent alcohol dehydrogenase [Sphaerochaetaceae bacterium]|nr:NAD(P)-dependent alcohol dehydrogenase [Sphaerochaetaceae bacterium]
MNKEMKVAVMEGIGKIGYINRKIQEPKDDEVLVKIEYVGICGSDLHYYEHGSIGNYVVEPPFVLGHEASGVVTKIGKDVDNLKIGDRVALEPGITCGKCEFCKTGRYNLCPDVVFFATPPIDGVFSEYTTHPSDLCFKLPENVSSINGALIEPLAVGFHAADQGGAKVGQKAIIFGAGCIGLMTLLALQSYGLNDITVVDILNNRLEQAKKLGATHVVNSLDKDYLDQFNEITQNKGYDIAFETAGTEITTRLSIQVLKKGSNLVCVGYSKNGEMTLPMSLLLDKEITIKTVFRYRHVYPKAIEAVASGKINPSDVVTNIFEFDDIQNAMDKSVEDKANIVKSVIRIS